MAILWGVQGNSCCCVLKLPHPSAGWGQFCAHWKKCRFPSAAGSDLIGKNVFLYLGAGALGGVGPIFDATVLILFSHGMFCYNTYRGAFEATLLTLHTQFFGTKGKQQPQAIAIGGKKCPNDFIFLTTCPIWLDDTLLCKWGSHI